MDFCVFAKTNITQLLHETVKEITLLLSWYTSASHTVKWGGLEKCLQNFSQHKGFKSHIVLFGTHSIHACLPKYVDVVLVGQKAREK